MGNRDIVHVVLNVSGWKLGVWRDISAIEIEGDLSIRGIGDYFRGGGANPYVRWPYLVWRVPVRKSRRGGK